MDFPESQEVFFVAAAAKIDEFLADRNGAPRMEQVEDEQLHEAALVLIAALHEDDPSFPSPERATEELVQQVIRESIGLKLEQWWKDVGSSRVARRRKRRSVWRWIQDQLDGTELLPAP
jgi:hypothetical protein